MKIRISGIAVLALTLILSISLRAQGRGETFALTNAKIVTVSGATIDKGTIVIRDGLIEAVGADAKVPADARVIDASGLTVYPGFFDALSNLGLAAPAQQPTRGPGGGGGPQAAQTAPTTNSNYPVGMQPEKNVLDDLRGGDAQFEAVRNAGFTTALTVGRDGVFNGRSAVINLAGETVSALVIRDNFGEHFSFRTVPGAYPASLLGTFSAFRQMMLDAQRLQKLQKAYAANPRGLKRPESDRSLEALFPVLDGAMPVVFNATTENEITRALDLAKEFNLKALIGGGLEAWKVADRLKAQNVPVLLSLNFPKRTAAASPDADPESLETLRLRAEIPKGAGVLAQKGVRFAFQSGGLTSPADFFANASKSVENGLSKDAALRAMTLSAAEILGVDNRLGSIETGKIANLTVTRGDIFGKDRQVTHVFVDGRLFEQKERPKAPPVANTPNATTTPALASVAGAWQITLEIPGQQLPGKLDLKQDGAIVSGTISTDATGSSPIKDGKATADGLSFSTTVTFGGATFDISVNGKVSGNQITGTLDSPQGAIPFSGTKIP
ncbi:MAG: amidohydrolase family protein [Acidobacteria bacterium]|nr:amidohydrolase family protein [Acidobacteriota bacterium]